MGLTQVERYLGVSLHLKPGFWACVARVCFAATLSLGSGLVSCDQCGAASTALKMLRNLCRLQGKRVWVQLPFV